jgi:predicted AlkP superfamily pyrophosphatase or phosphodiesterase
MPVKTRPAEAPRAVVVLAIDGLRRDYIDDSAHAIPTLRRLRDEGVVARSLESVWPSVTYPAFTTMATGVSPKRHGIVNNLPFDPREENAGGWFWYASDIRVPALWDVAAAAGIEVANVTWPVTVGANIRYNLPQFWRAKNPEDDKLLDALSTPGLFREVARHAPPPGEHRSDRARVDAAVTLITTKRPGLSLVYLADLDVAQHHDGPMSAPMWRVLEATDGYVAEILAAARATFTRFALVLVSDHGFLPTHRSVRPNVALRKAGLIEVDVDTDLPRPEEKIRTYEAATWNGGGLAAIMGKHGRAEPVASRVKALFEDLARDPANGIAAVFDGATVEEKGGFPGAIVVLQAAPDAMFSERWDEPMVAKSKYLGAHGYPPTLKEMAATLVLWGDGVRSRTAIGDVPMVRIAPTVASLLGLTMPDAEGAPLVEALAP